MHVRVLYFKQGSKTRVSVIALFIHRLYRNGIHNDRKIYNIKAIKNIKCRKKQSLLADDTSFSLQGMKMSFEKLFITLEFGKLS